MTKAIKIGREQITQAAFDMVKAEGEKVLNARSLAKALGCSTQPIFSNFSSMDEIKKEVIRQAEGLYTQYTVEEMQRTDIPSYKSSGMAYIRFARQEKQLFKLLFMRDRSTEIIPSGEILQPIIEIIKQSTGLSQEKAYLLHLEMWIYVHGIATMVATSYLEWEESTVSSMLTDVYQGVKDRFLKGENK